MTVASAPWTAVHVKQNYNAHETCLLLYTSFTGTHTAVSFCEINRDFRKKKNKTTKKKTTKRINFRETDSSAVSTTGF